MGRLVTPVCGRMVVCGIGSALIDSGQVHRVWRPAAARRRIPDLAAAPSGIDLSFASAIFGFPDDISPSIR